MEPIQSVAPTRKQQWYKDHKDDPEFKEKKKAAKRAYYARNKEVLIEKALERYYRIKAMIEE